MNKPFRPLRSDTKSEERKLIFLCFPCHPLYTQPQPGTQPAARACLGLGRWGRKTPIASWQQPQTDLFILLTLHLENPQLCQVLEVQNVNFK